MTQSGKLFDLKKLSREGGLKVGNIISVDPNLYTKYRQHMKRTVKHDTKIQEIIFKVCLSAFSKNPLNCGLRGYSSIGKTYNVMETIKYFPEEDVWLLGGLSKKALIHSYGVLCEENGEEINLADKPTRESVKQELRDFYSNLPEKKVTYAEIGQELEKQKRLWNEKLAKSYYVVDLKNKILVFLEAPDIEVFNILRPIFSHDAREISYKIADKNSSGSLRTKHVIIRNWPAAIFCTTDLEYLEDIATRFITATPEISIEKFKDANKLTGHKNALPFEFEEGEDFFQLRAYINFLRSEVQDLDVVLPFGRELGEAYPSYFARSMRDLKHFIELIKVSALFHYAQRPVLTIGETNYLFATKWDFDHVKEIWLDVEETTLTGLSGHILNFYHKAIEPLAKTELYFTYEQLTQKYNETTNEKKSSDTIRKWVNLLCDVGWLTKTDDPDDKRRKLVSVIKNSKNNGKCRIPEFNSFFSEDKLRNWLEAVKKLSEEKPVLLRENFISEYIKQDIIDMPEGILQAYSFIKETEKNSSNKPEIVSDNFSDTSKTKTGSKTKNKLEKSGFQNSPLILQCFDCRRILTEETPYTQYEGKPICFTCFNKIEAQKKKGEQKHKTVAVCSKCGLKYFEFTPDMRCNGSYETGVCNGLLIETKKKVQCKNRKDVDETHFDCLYDGATYLKDKQVCGPDCDGWEAL